MAYITAHAGAEGTKSGSLEDTKKAIEIGVDYIEMDIRVYGGTLYLSHDPLVIEHLQSYTTFEEALLVVKETKLKVNCDLKEVKATEKVIEIVKQHGMEERIAFSGAYDIEQVRGEFSFWVGIEYADILGEERVLEAQDAEKLVRAYLLKGEANCMGYNLDYRCVSESVINMLKEAGINLSLWTVDHVEQLQDFIEKRVPYITTNSIINCKKIRDREFGSYGN